MIRKALLFFILVLITGVSQAQFVRLDTVSVNKIENFISLRMATDQMMGLSVGIIRDGEVAYLKGFGYEDFENSIPATENTLYRLASVSKTVTGLISMRLREQGVLDLNKDIRDYVPEYPVKPEGTITSEELLSNESGILHYSGSGNCQENYDFAYRNNYINTHPSSYDPIAAMGIFKDQKLCFTPGADYMYTTWGFCLMGAVLQRAANRDFESLLYDEIVCPLDLPSLQIEFQSKRPYPNEAKGYVLTGGNIIPSDTNATDYKDISYKVPGGGMISSVIDLTMLMQGVVNRELITDSSVHFFGTRHIPGDGNPSYYGYGTSTNFRNGDTLYWHSGSQLKTATLIYYSPENKNGVVLMCNTQYVDLFPLARLIYDFLPSTSIEGAVFIPPGPSPECSSSGFQRHDMPTIQVYPNPGYGIFSVAANEEVQGWDIRITNIMGQVCYRGKLDGVMPHSLNLSLPNGFYQMHLSNQGKDKVLSGKFIVAK